MRPRRIRACGLRSPAEPGCAGAHHGSRESLKRPPFGGRGRRSRDTPLGDHALGLVLGDRERDVERLGGDLQLLAGAGKVDIPLLDRVRQPAEALDVDLDDVARLHGARVRRRPGEDDVARLERDRPAEVRELIRDAEEHVVGGRLLHEPLVHVRAEGEVGGVELRRRHELGSEREEPVLPLDPQHRAAVGVAEVVHPDVVGARVAGYMVEHLVNRHALHSPTDDDRELALVVEEACALRHPDRSTVAVECRRRLHEVRRLGRCSGGVLLDARAVREVDREDLRRLGRREVQHVALRDPRPVVEHDRVAVGPAPARLAVELDADAALADLKGGRHTPRSPRR
jgi:hypothetical protein